MNQFYKPFIDRVIDKYEGGYGWDRRDPGGPTKYGITCYDLAKHRHKVMGSMAAWAPIVKAMTREEAETIYHETYATTLEFDAQHPAVACCMLDYGVNSGVTRPIRVARVLLGLSNDVHFNEELLAKLKAVDPHKFVDQMCDERLHFMRGIRKGSAWKTFGKGWQARVDDLRKYCHALENKAPLPEATEVPVGHPKAQNTDPMAGGKQAKVAAGTAATAGAGQATMNVSAAYIFATFAAIFAATFVYHTWADYQAKAADASVNEPNLSLFARFIASFEQSGTIWLARGKTTLGGLFLAVQSSGIDMSQFISDPKLLSLFKVASAYLLADGVLSETVRRAGGAFNDKTDANS